LVTWIYFKIKGLVGLGGGDIKLYGVLGIFLGPFGIVQNIFLSCLLGSILGLIFILIGRMKKENPLPFGPFIILVAAIQIFFQDDFNRFLSLIL
jgi:leader peptidase (prepilin peptidase)/N-methyltransferase